MLQLAKAGNAHWAIAAATLRPDLAEGILKSTIAKLDPSIFGWDQAKMAAALPLITGAAHTPFALDWFYGRPPTETGTTSQEIFISAVVERFGSGGRAVLSRLVRDRRFDTIGEPALRSLIGRLNNRLSTPLVEWPHEYVADGEKNVTFAEWRKRVRDSVPRWK